MDLFHAFTSDTRERTLTDVAPDDVADGEKSRAVGCRDAPDDVAPEGLRLEVLVRVHVGRVHLLVTRHNGKKERHGAKKKKSVMRFF